MPRQLWLTMILAVVIVAAAAVYLLGDWGTDEEEKRPGASPGASESIDDPVNQGDSPVFEDDVSDPAKISEEEITKEAVQPAGLFISGRVTDRATSEPVTAFHLELHHLQHLSEMEFVGRVRVVVWEGSKKSKQGRFFVPVESSGEYVIEISSSKHKSASR